VRMRNRSCIILMCRAMLMKRVAMAISSI
jgi:hypothetical protein